MKIFNKLFHAADVYLKKSSWKDMALLKFCLFSIGVIAGLNICRNKKKDVQTLAGIVFLATYIPLMAKFISVLADEFKPEHVE